MSKYSLSSKIVAGACAASLALAMPVVAFAAPSPTNTSTVIGYNNVTIYASARTISGAALPADAFTISSVDQVAEGTPLTDISSVDAARLGQGGKIAIASFQVSSGYDLSDVESVDLTFNVGTQYAGSTVYLYVQNSDGTTSVQQVTVGSDGVCAVTLGGTGLVTVVVDADTIPEGSGVKADKGATAPQTGVSVAGVAAGTAGMAVAACVAGVALRKKVRA